MLEFPQFSLKIKIIDSCKKMILLTVSVLLETPDMSEFVSYKLALELISLMQSGSKSTKTALGAYEPETELLIKNGLGPSS